MPLPCLLATQVLGNHSCHRRSLNTQADLVPRSKGSRRALEGVHPLGSRLLRSGKITTMAGRLNINVFQRGYLVQLFPYRSFGIIGHSAVCAS